MSDLDALEQQAKEDSSSERNEPWKPEKGESLRGYVRDIAYPTMKDGSQKWVVTVEKEDGERVAVWLSSFVLKDEMLDRMPAKDSAIVIVFKGKVPNKDGTREYNSYTVAHELMDAEWWLGVQKAANAKRQIKMEQQGVPVVQSGVADGLEDPF